MAADRAEMLRQTNYWDELIRLRDAQRERQASAVQVIRGDELPVESNPLGQIQWYLHPAIKDTALSTLMFFRQIIPPGGRTGRLKFQGGQAIYVLEGQGYTILDGVRHPWEAGDTINLPLKKQGIIVQHFNADKMKPAVFIAAEPNWFECVGVDRGSGFELLEAAPLQPDESSS